MANGNPYSGWISAGEGRSDVRRTGGRPMDRFAYQKPEDKLAGDRNFLVVREVQSPYGPLSKLSGSRSVAGI